MAGSPLKNTRILAVDDEVDVLDTLQDILGEFEGLIFDRATDYDTGYQLLWSWTYDAVILDIMGVRGFELLKSAVHHGFPTVMLTAHAFSVEDFKGSIEMGARTYIPKENMMDIQEFLKDVVTLGHRTVLKKMLQRLGGVFTKRFGFRWMESEKDFWNQVAAGQYQSKPVILKK